MTEAYLLGADLRGGDTEESQSSRSRANGSNSCKELTWRRATLIRTVLEGAIITNACLWETQRAGWRIEGIICEAIYWDEEWERADSLCTR